MPQEAREEKPQSPRVLDTETFLLNYEGVEDLIPINIDEFLNAYKPILEEIRLAIESCNSNALENSAHTLKGAISNFYGNISMGIAHELECMGRTNNLSQAKEKFSVLESELLRFLEELKKLKA